MRIDFRHGHGLVLFSGLGVIVTVSKAGWEGRDASQLELNTRRERCWEPRHLLSKPNTAKTEVIARGGALRRSGTFADDSDISGIVDQINRYQTGSRLRISWIR